jgi:serine/threonine protein kinase
MDVVGHIRYTKLEQIGIGEGMNSKVYRATDPHLNGEIAVKEIQGHFGNDPPRVEEARRMFASEHDNVVKIRCLCGTTDLIAC